MKRPLLLLACVPLLAGAALLEHYAITRQRLQLGVDSAAAGGAHAVAEGRDIEATVRARLARAQMLRPGDEVEIELPPATGRFRGWKRAVRIRIRRSWSPLFVPRGVADRMPLDVMATAVAVPPEFRHPRSVALRVE